MRLTIMVCAAAMPLMAGCPNSCPPPVTCTTSPKGGFVDPSAVYDADVLCPPAPYAEEVNPQSHLVRGGCLQNFQHFYDERGSVPPAKPLNAITAYHYKYNNIALTVKKTSTTSVSDAHGKPIAHVPLYRVSAKTKQGQLDLCTGQFVDESEAGAADPSRDQEGTAVAVPGYWRFKRGTYLDSLDKGEKVFTLACTRRSESKRAPAESRTWPGNSGAAGKCVELGYVPWAKAPKSGAKLDGHFRACVAATRAQYGNDGKSFTCRGTEIDIYDNVGIKNRDGQSSATYAFEAAWGGEGLICRTRPRYKACEDDDTFKGTLKCKDEESFDDISRWPSNVLIVNRSRTDNETPKNICPSVEHGCE